MKEADIKIGEIKKTTKFVEMEIDIDEKTRQILIEHGSRKFNELPDEAIESLMIDYGFTLLIEDYIKNNSEALEEEQRQQRPPPIITHANKSESKDDKQIPHIELADFVESILSMFLKSPSKEELRKKGFFNSMDWAEEMRYSYLKMNRSQRVKYVQRWLDGISDEQILNEEK